MKQYHSDHHFCKNITCSHLLLINYYLLLLDQDWYTAVCSMYILYNYYVIKKIKKMSI
jgi:hypothetical protein